MKVWQRWIGRWAVAGLCAWMGPALAQSAPPKPATVQLAVGGQTLPFVVPKGYADAASLSPDLQRMGEAMTVPNNRLVAFWVDPAEFSALTQGQADGLKRYFMLQVHRRLEQLPLQAADFETVRKMAIGDQAAFTQQLREKLPQATDQINAQMGRATGNPDVKLKVGEPQPMGVLFDEPKAFGYLMRAPFDIGDGRPMTMLVGTVMLRHGDRLIALGVYAADEGPEAEAWVRQTAKVWARDMGRLK